MNDTPSLYRWCCAWLFVCGGGLMLIALFLHPMRPQDFLSLAASAPLQTVGAVHAAFLFWVSAAMSAVGLAGLLIRPRRRAIL